MDDIASDHNWSKDKIISVYQDFIYENNLDDKVGQFAYEVAQLEKDAIHFTEEDDPTPYDFDEDPDRDDDTFYDDGESNTLDWQMSW